MSNVIEFHNVWKKFRKGEKFNSLRDAVPALFRAFKNGKNDVLAEREFWAVRDVTFDIRRGEVVGILGHNGAGKSTVLKLLSRIMDPNKGGIELHGRLSALIEVTAGFHPELTGRENVYLNGTILGMKKREIDERFEQIVEFSGISEFIDTPVKRYSSGMYSRLGFSVAAHINPEILLVDEVLSVGDISFQAKCAEKMRELLSSGVTIVLVSHNLALIQNLCRRVILLDHGKILQDGPTNTVLPLYENIVLEQREEEFKKKIKATMDDYKVKLDIKRILEIKDIRILNGRGQEKKSLQSTEELKIEVDYIAEERVESPVLLVEIIRSDGIICCSAQTHPDKPVVQELRGAGKIKIGLGRLNLAGGIYLVKAAVLDRDMIHPYASRSTDVLKIAADNEKILTQAVMLPEVQWEVDTREQQPKGRSC